MSKTVKDKFEGWEKVASNLKNLIKNSESDKWLNPSQKKALKKIAINIPRNGIILADEVGMGKTRIAAALVQAVKNAGGRVAIIIPPGLGYQWSDELRKCQVDNVLDIIRGYSRYLFGLANSNTDELWYNQSVLLISHVFVNWTIREKSSLDKITLLPEVYAQYRLSGGRFPRHYSLYSKNYISKNIKLAAKNLSNLILNTSYRHWAYDISFLENMQWNESLFKPSYYSKGNTNTNYREYLIKLIGYGLGKFDLIVLDEAHKNKGEETGLSALLNKVINVTQNSRILALSATPVELSAGNWQTILQRIKVSENEYSFDTIEKYLEIVKQMQISWKFNQQDIEKFERLSKKFESNLNKYLIRRDKRKDPSVICFSNKTNLPYYKYRKEKEIQVNPAENSVNLEWRKALIAAESLSFVTSQDNDMQLKRLRLTIANGHGLGTFIDMPGQRSHDKLETAALNDLLISDQYSENEMNISSKKTKRVNFWKNIITEGIGRSRSIYQHPALLETIACIENEYTAHSEKVLVFGKFTRPMKVLTQLLNAREMLRRLDQDKLWPQYSLDESSDDNEVEATMAAIRQLKNQLKDDWDIEKVKNRLLINKRKNENSRKRFSKRFRGKLLEGLSNLKIKQPFINNRLYKLLEEMVDKKLENHTQLAHACFEVFYNEGNIETIDSTELARTAMLLVENIIDNDRMEFDPVNVQESEGYIKMISSINDDLKDEYGMQIGKFARLLYGGTKHETRRLLQTSFNRKNSFPMVLVAQSMVGREGLNLHKACKTVIMIHPEWNPAVAEQQLGRVDRLDSLWSHDIEKYIPNDGEPPQIVFRPVIFKETYDEHNWNVLHARWDDLRAQLHGIIIPDRQQENCTTEEKMIIERINKTAPNFEP